MSLIYLLQNPKADDIFRLFVDDDKRKKYYLERIAQCVANVGVKQWHKFIDLIYDDIMASDVPLLSSKVYYMWYKYLSENPNNDLVVK